MEKLINAYLDFWIRKDGKVHVWEDCVFVDGELFWDGYFWQGVLRSLLEYLIECFPWSWQTTQTCVFSTRHSLEVCLYVYLEHSHHLFLKG